MPAKENLRRLTIVVPTYERQSYVLRLVNYWAGKGPQLVIIDGSAVPIPSHELQHLANYVQYIHNPVGLHKRLSVSLDFIQTEFVVRAGDDEFYLPSALDSCIEEMDKDNGLVACCGRALGFSSFNGNVFGRAQYQKFSGYHISSGNSGSRVIHHLRDYAPTLVYAVCRSQQWKVSWKHIVQHEFPFFASREIQFEMFMAFAGRSRVIAELMWLRSHGETHPIRGSEPSLDDKNRLPSWWADAGNEKEHEEFILIMSRGFNELLPSADGDLRGAAIAGVEAYLEFYRNDTSSRGSLPILKRMATKIIPDLAKPFLKSMVSRLRRYKSDQHAELLQAARILEGSGVRVDFSSLEEIQKTIIQFHKNRSSVDF